MAKRLFLFLIVCCGFAACTSNAVVDTNDSVRDGQWLYPNSAKASFDIKDVNIGYDFNFKLRINTDYRYSNLYVVTTLKSEKGKKRKVRYGFKVANEDGTWLGKGSGNLYTFSFPILRNYRFADTGKYTFEVEQNMRDNPLMGVSDIGIEILKR